jgi:S-adenosylmethionine uptake transporter
MSSQSSLRPYIVTLSAIALLSLMDAYMKAASIAVGAYSALLLRSALSAGLLVPIWKLAGGAIPERSLLRLHLKRGVVISFMALTFFSALVLLPMAEAIALSFISPLIALALAALLLGERIERKAMLAALLGIVGVAVIVGGRFGRERMSEDAMLGIALVLGSAFLYAWNLILQRQQAQLARPLEIATFQNLVVGCVLAVGAPWFLHLPGPGAWSDIGIAALLGVGGSLGLAWAYARAEAQVLVPIEYSGFLWAALFGWLYFGETVSGATLAGAVLIVIGCWIAAPRKPPEQAAT